MTNPNPSHSPGAKHGQADAVLVGLQTGDGLVLMDLHGARERVLFDALDGASSPLYEPIPAPQSARQLAPALEALGFAITLGPIPMLAAVPTALAEIEPRRIVSALARLENDAPHDALRLALCSALVHETLDPAVAKDPEASRDIYRRLRAATDQNTCPHGVPIVFSMFNMKPTRLGRFVIVPSLQDFEPAENELPIAIRPGISFGIGTHATTQLPLLFLQDHLKPRDSVADIGVGTGILSIAALRLGAARTFSVDTDPLALEEARANFALNGLSDRATLAEGSADQLDGLFDLIVTNMNRPQSVLKIAPDVAAHLRDGGLFVASGIYESHGKTLAEWDQTITAELADHNLTLESRAQKDGCLGIVARKQ